MASKHEQYSQTGASLSSLSIANRSQPYGGIDDDTASETSSLHFHIDAELQEKNESNIVKLSFIDSLPQVQISRVTHSNT